MITWITFGNRDSMKIRKDLLNLLNLGGFRFTKMLVMFPKLTKNNSFNCCKRHFEWQGLLELSIVRFTVDHGSHSQVFSLGVNRELQACVTQRTVLNFVLSVIDPIGLVAPYTVKARLLLKDIWRITGQQCDDSLPEVLPNQFIEWHSSLFI